jgi:peptidoglycan/LPS O-acetylase OafA/YrhL
VDGVVRGRRIPSLDGLRAIAIGLVLLEHLRGTAGFPSIPALDCIEIGKLGVRIFFVISGFLITSLLLRESQMTGSIDLRAFYVRRVLRIFPAFYIYVTVVALLDTAGGSNLVATRAGDYLAAITYTANYHRDHGWTLGHIWSLSVEEQFYLVWPAIVMLAGRTWSLRLAVFTLALAPALRFALGHLGQPAAGIGERFETICDAIATGCVLAGLRGRLDASAAYRRWLRSPAWLLAPALVAVVATVGVSVVGQTLLDLGIAISIDRVVRISDDRIGRILNGRTLVFIGTLSYSLYLWQQLFLARWLPGTVHAFPWNLGCAFVAAYLSYTVVEKPILEMRSLLRARRVV